MRVPNAGQDLVERRIVREGKRLAEIMLADYVDPPSFTLPGVFRQFDLWRQQVLAGLRDGAIRR